MGISKIPATGSQKSLAITATGATSVPIPSGVTGFNYLLVGPGGGGGGGNSAAAGGGGGGGGGQVKVGFFPVTSGASSLTVTLGAGGAGGAADTNGSVSATDSTISDGTLTVTAEKGYAGLSATNLGYGGKGGGVSEPAQSPTGIIFPGSFGGAGGGHGGTKQIAWYTAAGGAQPCPGYGKGGTSASNNGGGGGGSYGNGPDGGAENTNGTAAANNSGAGGSGADGDGKSGGAGGSGYCILTWIG